MICYHHNDLDGRCAGAIVLMKHPAFRMREIDYKDDPVFQEEIEVDEKLFIVDFSFKPKKMRELFLITPSSRVVWIDHHKTAKDYVYETEFAGGVRPVSLEGLCDFSEPGKSGCELTWEYLYPSKPMPEAVRLLGDYDTFRFDTPRNTKLFQMGMKSVVNNPNAPIWTELFGGFFVDKVINDGITVTAYRDNFCANYRDSFGWVTHCWGRDCYVINLGMIGSLGFSDKMDEYDLCISLVCQASKWTVSLYSKTVDVSEIASRYGGGGHTGAAGFVCEKLPF